MKTFAHVLTRIVIGSNFSLVSRSASHRSPAQLRSFPWEGWWALETPPAQG
ncbi:hypothetical protein [Pseudarthrobacter oxydans]|uniref:hypothetical protein n=1 Tax=Pseudarthrobacter oxydans TaxID=1671 RepID=UPI00382A7382